MTHDEKLHVSFLALRSELGTWGAARRESNHHGTPTQVHDRTLEILGTEQHAKHKLSAAGTWKLNPLLRRRFKIKVRVLLDRCIGGKPVP